MKNTDLIAVAKPEFKKGDFIVFDTTKPHCRLLPSDLMEYVRVSPNSEHDALVLIGNRFFEVGGKVIRHATPAEIKAGCRINGALTNEGTKVGVLVDSDDVADISYRVSPSTRVSER